MAAKYGVICSTFALISTLFLGGGTVPLVTMNDYECSESRFMIGSHL